MISDFAESVVAPAQSKTVDNYWGDCSKIFLIALVLMLMDSVTPEYFNIKTLITPEQWVAKITGDVFKFPYPKVKECA